MLAHHLLLIWVFLLFQLHYLYFQKLPNFFLAHQIGNLPYIVQELLFYLMGYREWLTLILLGASTAVALRWAGRIPKPVSPAVWMLALAVLAGFAVKESVIHWVTSTHVIHGPVERKAFKIHGFIPFLARQYAAYQSHGYPEPLPWPGKINAVQRTVQEAAPRPQDLQNVLIVQIESLDKWVVDRQVDGQDVMPRLRRLLSQSRRFPNFFSMHVTRSADAEVAAITSLLPQRYVATRARNLPQVPSLARVLSWHRYRTVAMHANVGGYYNRWNAYRWLGFDRFRDATSYTGDAAGNWKSKDREFFRQSWQHLMGLPEPFFAYLITIQGHAPFTYAEDTLAALNVPAGREGDYIREMHEIDQAIGFLLDELDRSGLAERSILLLYADHPSYLFEPGCIHRKCVPFLIRAPGLQPGVDPRPASHIDIAPTLLELLGIPEAPETFLGSSLLSPGNRKVLFRDGVSIHRDPATGDLALRQDASDQKYIRYSDAAFGGRAW